MYVCAEEGCSVDVEQVEGYKRSSDNMIHTNVSVGRFEEVWKNIASLRLPFSKSENFPSLQVAPA